MRTQLLVARCRLEQSRPALVDLLVFARAALGARFGRMRRMTLGKKLLADFFGHLALQRGDDLFQLTLGHASHAKIRPHRAGIGPGFDEPCKLGIGRRQDAGVHPG